MPPLRQRRIEDLQLRGFSARTQESYATALRQLAEHYHTRPDRLTEEDLRQSFLSLANEKKGARATETIALCGIQVFYEHTLPRSWTPLRFTRPPREQKLPVVLSRDEVRRILAEVRTPLYRVCLTTVYACGLRLLEGAHLQVPDVDSARLVRHLHGKRTGLAKRAHVPTLRHAHATHLLEAGVPLRIIQENLGHGSARTPQVSTHLTREVRATLTDPLTQLIQGL